MSERGREWHLKRGAVEVVVRVAEEAEHDDHALAEDAASAARTVLRGAGGDLSYGVDYVRPAGGGTARGRLIFNDPNEPE